MVKNMVPVQQMHGTIEHILFCSVILRDQTETSVYVGTQEGRYTKGGPLPTVNPIRRVMSSSIPVAKLGRAVTSSTWQQTLRKYARQLIQGAG